MTTSIKTEEPENKDLFLFQIIDNSQSVKEEDMEYFSDDEVLFKVILIEVNNTERKRYVILNKQEKHLSILKSSD